MTQRTSRAMIITFAILGSFIMVTGVAFWSFIHSFLHVEFHPLDKNHLVVGSATALLSALLVVTLFLRTRTLSREVKEKEFELSNIYEDNVFFRLIASKSSDMVHLNDSTGKILYVNPVTYDLLGYDKDEIINKPAENFVHPEDRGKIRQDMGQVAHGKDVPPREIRLLQKSGDFLETEVKGFFLNTESDEKYIGAILRDLSKNKQNESLLIIKEEWEKTFNSISDFVSVHDKDFKIVRANSALCELLGKSHEDIVGKPCYQLFHNLNGPFENCPHTKTAATNSVTTEIVSDPNIGVPLEITCSPIFNNEGTFQGSVHIARIQDEKTKDDTQDFIPVCSACKKIRDSENVWVLHEDYFMRRYDCQFTHTICDECAKILYPEYLKF